MDKIHYMKLPNIGFKDLLKSLIQNNSGHSSKTAAYLLGVTTGCFCVLLITLYLGYDILRDGRIDTDMVALAALITSYCIRFVPWHYFGAVALAALITSYAAFAVGVSYPKVRGERYENNHGDKKTA